MIQDKGPIPEFMVVEFDPVGRKVLVRQVRR